MPREVKIIKITNFPPDIPRVAGTNQLYATTVKNLDDLKELARIYRRPILLKENYCFFREKEIHRTLLGFFDVVNKKTIIENYNVYLVKGENRERDESPMWYVFWEHIISRDFPEKCDICKKKVSKEDAIVLVKGKHIITLHKKCYEEREEKIDEIIETAPEEKIPEIIKTL